MIEPDDWHLHLRDGPRLKSLLSMPMHCKRAIVMPNLKPPVVNTEMALAYKKRIKEYHPHPDSFIPLMTLYLTDKTTPEEIRKAKKAGIVALKLYPAGATTNSDSGVTDVFKLDDTLQAMSDEGLLLLIHGEVTDSKVDFFDREAVFIERTLKKLVPRFPKLKIVLEHITTKQAVDYVMSAPDNIAATITPQHLLFNRNIIFEKGLKPHYYCLPILKAEDHRQALNEAIQSGSKKFFLGTLLAFESVGFKTSVNITPTLVYIGTDSAPHWDFKKECDCCAAGCFTQPIALPLYVFSRFFCRTENKRQQTTKTKSIRYAEAFEKAGVLEKLEAFASFNGPDFYGLPRNKTRVRLKRGTFKVPTSYGFGDGVVKPLLSGKNINWSVERIVDDEY